MMLWLKQTISCPEQDKTPMGKTHNRQYRRQKYSQICSVQSFTYCFENHLFQLAPKGDIKSQSAVKWDSVT